MADTKISALTAATTPLAGTEVLPIVQGGVTKQVSVANLTAGRAVSMASGTITGDLTVDTNTLYANSTAHEVCVGTTTSINVGKFNVKGDSTHNTICATPYANGYYNYFGTNTSGTGTFYVRGDGISYFAGEMTVAAQLNNTGNHVITSGNVVPATAAKGINFTANTAAAGMTSQLLNWYEEGTFTPVVTDATYDATMGSNNYGKYTRIGRLVVCEMYVEVSSYGSVGPGNLYISGWPSSITNSGGCVGTTASGLAITAGQSVTLRRWASTLMAIEKWDATTGTTVLTKTAWPAGGAVAFALTYFV